MILIIFCSQVKDGDKLCNRVYNNIYGHNTTDHGAKAIVDEMYRQLGQCNRELLASIGAPNSSVDCNSSYMGTPPSTNPTYSALTVPFINNSHMNDK